MIKTICIAFLVILNNPANAAVLVKKINKEESKVAVSFEEEDFLVVGDKLEIKDKEDSCTITIFKIVKQTAIGKTDCKDELSIGIPLVESKEAKDNMWDEKNNDEIDSEEVLNEPKKKKIKNLKEPKKAHIKSIVGIGIGYNFAKEVSFSGTLNSVSSSGTLTTNNPISVSAFILKAPEGKIGGYISLDYELLRKCKGLVEQGVSYECYTETKTLSILSNLAYGINNDIIIYAGINYPASIKVEYSVSSEYEGSIGYQMGLIAYVNEYLFASLEYRNVKFNQIYTDGINFAEYDYEVKGVNLKFGTTF
jgi:hypothetical protein